MGDSQLEGLSSLELLPIEVVAVIASYLKVKDVIQCCATSSSMREMFNDNSIWRPRCNKELSENLKKTPGKVAPIFVEPQIKNSSLSPLPDWRLSYMREYHLWNNWRKGKFIKEYIKHSNSSADFHMFYNNDCVLARYHDRLEILDVRVFPASDLVESIYFDTKSLFDLKIEITYDMIILMVGSRVQVFVLDLKKKKCNLKHTFFFESSHSTPTTNRSHEGQRIFKGSNREFKGQRLIVGHVLVGILEGESTLHIWNLETGQKLKEETCALLKPCPVLEIKASETMNVVLTIGKAIQKTKTFLAYSLEKLKFLSFKETQEMSSEYFVHKDFVVIKFNNIVEVFNYITSKKVAFMPTDSLPKALKNNLLFIKDGDIKTFNLIKNTTESMSLDHVSKFEILGDKFLQIKRNDWRSRDIWEIDETCQHLRPTNMKFYFDSCGFFLNKACTRYIVREAVGNILNFW